MNAKDKRRTTALSEIAALVGQLVRNAKDKRRDTALRDASRHGEVEAVRELLAAGADVNREGFNGETALILAARGRVEIIRELLAAGADVNAKDANRRTALFTAESSGHGEIVRDLLAAGAVVDESTAMMWASIGRHPARSFEINGDSELARLARKRDLRDHPHMRNRYPPIF